MSALDAKARPAGVRYVLGEATPAPGEALEIADGVLWLRMPLPMKLDHVNVYALDDGDGWTLVDTGFDMRATREAWEAALAGPLAGKPVTRVIATHHHPDHIGLAGWFQDRGAALWTTRTAWLYCRALQLDHHDEVPQARIDYLRQAGAPQAEVEAAIARGPMNFSRITAPLAGFRRIAEGDEVRAGGRRWRVMCGNGHAPEHATLWSLDDDLALVGDQILSRISPNLGVYPTEPEADPVGEWLESCRRFQTVAEERHLLLPGHDRPFTGAPLRLRQLIENHTGALARIRREMTRPVSAVDCFDAIYKRPISSGEFGLALAEAVGHLNHLWATGEARKRLFDDGVLRYELTETRA